MGSALRPAGEAPVCQGPVWERRQGGGAGRAQAGLPPCSARRNGAHPVRMLGGLKGLARPDSAAAPIIKRRGLTARAGLPALTLCPAYRAAEQMSPAAAWAPPAEAQDVKARSLALEASGPAASKSWNFSVQGCWQEAVQVLRPAQHPALRAAFVPSARLRLRASLFLVPIQLMTGC